MLLDATLFVAISSVGGGESIFCVELRSLPFYSVSRHIGVQPHLTIMVYHVAITLAESILTCVHALILFQEKHHLSL